MAVLSVREVIPRTFSHRFGESPSADRKFVATLDGPTNSQDIINAIGIGHGAAHPEFPSLRMLDASLSEPDAFHAEVSLGYSLPEQTDGEFEPNPLSRPDVWSFSVGGAQVPALVYYDGSGNLTRKPLTNTANDFFEGLTVSEAEVRATITGNRASFPLAIAAAVTNSVNSSSYLGGAAHTWFCAGIGGQQASEVVNNVTINYWQITVELLFRASGHDLQLPNVGWNFVVGGQRRRCYVIDWENNEYLPSSTPRPLTESGNIKAGDEGPDILVRRVYPEVNFSSYFGEPTF